MDWDKLKIFHAVAEAGSFTSATVNLNLSQSIKEISLEGLLEVYPKMLKGETSGRYIVDLNK